MNPMRIFEGMRTINKLLTDAERIAREMGEREPGAEHLLLSALALPDGSANRALGRVGADAEAVRSALRAEQADALVTAGVPRDTAEAMPDPAPFGPPGTPVLYHAAPSAREVFQEAGKLARSSRQRLAGAHVVAAIADLERGTMPRVLKRLSVDREQLAEAARAELGVG